MYKPTGLLIISFLLGACAQLPASTVTLSNSVTNDVNTIRASHLNFVHFYFDELEAAVNQFIDQQYKPAYIKERFAQQFSRSQSSDPNEQASSLFIGIKQAFSGDLELDDPNCLKGSECYEKELAVTQEAVLDATNKFFTSINNRIENERKELLAPLVAQRMQLVGNLEQQYANVLGKNAVVTSMLASIVEVHETQQQLLTMLGVKEDLRTDVGTKLSDLSKAVADGVRKIDEVEQNFNKLEGGVDTFKQALQKIK
jgi:hypothetical protein